MVRRYQNTKTTKPTLRHTQDARLTNNKRHERMMTKPDAEAVKRHRSSVVIGHHLRHELCFIMVQAPAELGKQTSIGELTTQGLARRGGGGDGVGTIS